MGYLLRTGRCLVANAACAQDCMHWRAIGAKRDWQDAINSWDARFVAAARGRDEVALAAMATDLCARLLELLDHWRAAQADPRWYFPKTSWAAATRPEAGVAAIAWQRFLGWRLRRHRRARLRAPGYARLLAGEARLDAQWLQGDALSAHRASRKNCSASADRRWRAADGASRMNATHRDAIA